MYIGLAIQKGRFLGLFLLKFGREKGGRGQARTACVCVHVLDLVYIIVHTAVLLGERYQLATIGWLVA